jgi:replicative DNA helicase
MMRECVDLKIEQAVLGTLLATGKLPDGLLASIPPEAFSDDLHIEVFIVAREEAESGRAISPMVIMPVILHRVGGDRREAARYISSLTTCIEPVGVVRLSVEQLLDLYRRRQLIERMQAMALVIDLPTRHVDFIERAAGLREQIVASVTVPTDGSKIEGAIERMWARFEAVRRGEALPLLTTGFSAIDQMLDGGFEADQLVVLGGRPAHGKSALSSQIALHVARQGYPVLIWSGEMSADQLTRRLLATMSDVPASNMRTGNLGMAAVEAVVTAERVLKNLPIEIDDRPGLTVDQIVAAAEAFAGSRPLGLIVVDHLHLIGASAQIERQGRVAKLTDISGKLKRLAKTLHWPVLALSQLSRALEGREDKSPQLSDLRDSGAIEQDADVVTFIYRPELTIAAAEPVRRSNESPDAFDDRRTAWEDMRRREAGHAQFIAAKVREGIPGAVDLRFSGAVTRFTDDWSY